MWNTEYELQEPSPTARAIMPEKVSLMFKKSLGTYAGDVDELIIIEKPSPIGTYVHGADWAKETDYTVIVTVRIEVRPYRIVAFERKQRRPWPDMVDSLDKRIDMYGGVTALFLVAPTGMVLNALLTDPINTGITFGIILAGVPVFYLWFRPRMAAGTEQ